MSRMHYWNTHPKLTHKKVKRMGLVRSRERGRELSALLSALGILDKALALKDSQMQRLLVPGARGHVAKVMRVYRDASYAPVPYPQYLANLRSAFEVMARHG